MIGGHKAFRQDEQDFPGLGRRNKRLSLTLKNPAIPVEKLLQHLKHFQGVGYLAERR